MRSDLEFINEINRYMRYLMESGIIVHWNRINQRKRVPELREPPPLHLTVEDLGCGFLFTIGLGLTAAIIIFFAEVFVANRKAKRDGSRKWTYLEWIFDGKRHFMINLPETLQRQT